MLIQSQDSGLRLKQVQPEELAAMTEFYRETIVHTKDMSIYGRWIYGLHPTEEMICGYIRSGVMYRCEKHGQLCSAFALTPSQGSDYHETAWAVQLADDDVAVLHLLCVDPRYQRQGIGRGSMELAIGISREMGKKALRLDALACNTPAQRLYESLGFQKRGTAYWFASNVGWTEFYLYELLL